MSDLFGFVLERDETILELNARARLYHHARTGARLLSVSNDDENKVFGITFRTPPTDSTGLPHILEHSVLGGSQKYPLKEPFLELVKGSLKTFLNAMTYPDKTVYPVASTNLKDFYNLTDVYLDAVFFPLLTPEHLAQEGWHYEVEEEGDEASTGSANTGNASNNNGEPRLAYKGVVFNEMKGAYSAPESLLGRYGQQTLFPDTPYRHDSGGDPAEITSLTYAQFKQFHETYYHPANALIFFYGDDEPTERLRLLAEYLDRFDALQVESEIPLQPALTEPRRFTYTYGVDAEADNSRKSLFEINWLLPEYQDMNLSMALSVLSYALIGSQASPLRKALVDSGLGEDVYGGVSGAYRQMGFSVGMKNFAAEDEDAITALIFATMEQVAAEGFDTDMIEAALNSIEFSLRENNTGGAPRGLSLYLRALGTWLYDGDPLAPLRYEAPLAYVKQKLSEDPAFLQGLIRTYLLENNHRVTVTLHPDANYNQQLEADEAARLASAQAAMDAKALAHVRSNADTLRAMQNRADPPELLDALPSLTLGDLEPTNRTIPTAIEPLHEGQVLVHDLFTNGILYLTFAWDMQRLPQHLLPYVDLFGQALTQMGTTSQDYVKLSQRIGRKTGGIGASSFVSSIAAANSGPDTAAWFKLGGKATLAQAPDMLEIMQEILATVRLDNRDRLRQIVLRNKSRMEGSLVPSGHVYVDDRLRAGFSTADWAEEQMDGIDNLFFHRNLAELIDTDYATVEANLESVRAAIIAAPGMLVNATVDAAGWEQVRPSVEQFAQSLPKQVGSAPAWQPDKYPANEGFTLPAQVNYVGKGANLYEVGYNYHGSLNVISNVIRTGWLWDRIRVQGGAYGAFCSFDRRSGVFSFTSYRDPNLTKSLDVYDQTAAWLRNVDISPKELTRAIIGAISSFDPYMLPDAKGRAAFHRYILGDSEADLQRIREQILGTTVADIHAFGDVLAEAAKQSRVVVLGSVEAIGAANTGAAGRDKGWLVVQRVL
jgi:Zn-dependent M16 (insulinase) family peptidase